jgi:hypothetical protein
LRINLAAELMTAAVTKRLDFELNSFKAPTKVKRFITIPLRCRQGSSQPLSSTNGLGQLGQPSSLLCCLILIAVWFHQQTSAWFGLPSCKLPSGWRMLHRGAEIA